MRVMRAAATAHAERDGKLKSVTLLGLISKLGVNQGSDYY